jgi:hypothetical protein
MPSLSHNSPNSNDDDRDAAPAIGAVHGDTVERLHQDLRDRLTADAGLTWDGVAEATKTPKSTVRDRLMVKAARRRPIKLVGLDDLTTWLARVGADKAEIDEWVRRRENLLRAQFGSVAEPDPVADDPDRTAGDDDRRPSTPRRVFLGAGAIVVFAAGVLVGVVIGRATAPSPATDAGSGSPATTAAPGVRAEGTPCGRLPLDLRDGAVPAKVGDTGGRGVTMYGGPGNTFCQAGALSEGREIRVVCLEPDGQPITDEFGGTIVTSTVWAKLSSGGFIPHVYTTLPPSDGQLVAGLSRC